MVRKADECDLEEILFIYDEARAYMRQMGNPCQWQGSYPGRAVLEYDIDQEQLYVLYDDFGIYGVFMMRIGRREYCRSCERAMELHALIQ